MFDRPTKRQSDCYAWYREALRFRGDLARSNVYGAFLQAGSVLTVCLGLGLVWFCSAHRLDHRRDAAGDKLDTGAAADTKPHVGERV